VCLYSLQHDASLDAFQQLIEVKRRAAILIIVRLIAGSNSSEDVMRIVNLACVATMLSLSALHTANPVSAFPLTPAAGVAELALQNATGPVIEVRNRGAGQASLAA
jgi:hypothetical protein